MKAKIKQTGEIIEVEKIIEYSEIPGTPYGSDYEYYKDVDNKKSYNEDELDFINIYLDWQQIRIQAAIAAMQGIMSSISSERFTLRINENGVAKASIEYADALIAELKKGGEK